MDKNQNNQTNPNKTGNLTDEKTNEDFNNKKPLPNDPELKMPKPETEFPIAPDNDKETEEEITKDEIEGNTEGSDAGQTEKKKETQHANSESL